MDSGDRAFLGIAVPGEQRPLAGSPNTMQKVCKVCCGVKAYQANPRMLVTPETRICPFCSDGHRLWLHGTYDRWDLLPDPGGSLSVCVQRLLCPIVGQTVSLLPDFCLPRRQHGPAILGRFLVLWVLGGLGLLEALLEVRREAPGHSVAQSLRDGSLRRLPEIRAYVAAMNPRAREPPKGIDGPRRLLFPVVQELCTGFPDPESAFTHHARQFHARFGLSLA